MQSFKRLESIHMADESNSVYIEMRAYMTERRAMRCPKNQEVDKVAE